MFKLTSKRSLKFIRAFAAQASRDARYASIETSDIALFESILGKKYVKTTEIDDYNTDWMKWYKGTSTCVLLPESTEQVSQILKHCSRRKLAVVPQGGKTGLVGGSVPVFDEVVLSVSRINRKFQFDPLTGILTCDAGITLQDLDERIAAKGFMMPLDLGAKGSCHIGGNVATAAGGIRLLRYGSLHAHLLGLTAVIPDADGTILNLGSALRKDNTSLHAPHLFLGSEGQLGVITSVTMTTVSRPSSVISSLIGVNTFEDCCSILSLAKKELGEILSSFEMMDRESLTVVRDMLGFKSPLESDPRFTLLIETSGSNASHDSEKVASFLNKCMEQSLAVDGVQAQSVDEAKAMWQLRESGPLAVAKRGYTYKHDVSLPLQHFYRLTELCRELLRDKVTDVVTWGHMGDGNSHLNIIGKEFSQEVYDMLYPFLYEWVVEHGGSISAEHGIGQLKKDYAHFGKQPQERRLVHDLKRVFDPNAILNPYKMF